MSCKTLLGGHVLAPAGPAAVPGAGIGDLGWSNAILTGAPAPGTSCGCAQCRAGSSEGAALRRARDGGVLGVSSGGF